MNSFINIVENIGEKTILFFKKIFNKCKTVLNKIKTINIKDQKIDIKNKGNRIAGIIVVSICIVIICFFISCLNGRSIDKTIDKFFTMYFELKTDLVEDIFPSELINQVVEEYKDNNHGSTRNQAIRDFELEIQDSIREGLNDITEKIGYSWEYSYEIKSTKDLDKEYLNEYFDSNVSKKYNDIKEAEIEVTFESESRVLDKDTVYLTLAKKNNNWYVISF